MVYGFWILEFGSNVFVLIKLSDFCGLYAWDGCLCSLIWLKMSNFCVLCAWEGCLCSLVWWKWVIFVYYVLEKTVCVVWLGEVECLLMSMCMRVMIMWHATAKISEFEAFVLEKGICMSCFSEIEWFWCMCAWEGCLCGLV